MIVHNYGPGKSMASLHVEVANDVDIEISHEIVDRIEREARKALGVYLVIHMDPIEVNDEETNKIKEVVKSILKEIDETLEFHDFRIVPGVTHTNILFDVVMPFEYPITPKELKDGINDKIKLHNDKWIAVIHVDQMYNRIVK